MKNTFGSDLSLTIFGESHGQAIGAVLDGMTMEEARSHPERAHLTSFVGLEELELVDYNVSPVPLRPGDRVLLCSDGLFKTLSLQEMTEILASSRGFGAQEELLAAVRQKAKRKQDNVTVVLLYCDPVE